MNLKLAGTNQGVLLNDDKGYKPGKKRSRKHSKKADADADDLSYLGDMAWADALVDAAYADEKPNHIYALYAAKSGAVATTLNSIASGTDLTNLSPTKGSKNKNSITQDTRSQRANTAALGATASATFVAANVNTAPAPTNTSTHASTGAARRIAPTTPSTPTTSATTDNTAKVAKSVKVRKVAKDYGDNDLNQGSKSSKGKSGKACSVAKKGGDGRKNCENARHLQSCSEDSVRAKLSASEMGAVWKEKPAWLKRTEFWSSELPLAVTSKNELIHCIESGFDLSRCDISALDDLSYVFYKRNLPKERWLQIQHWDTRNVRNFAHMFEGSNIGSINLSTWDMRRAVDLSYMFCDCSKFNANLNNWQVSSVKSLAHTFQNARRFRGDISKWDTHNVLSMESMLQGASMFNGDLRGWTVNQVVNWSHAFERTWHFLKLGAVLREWHFDAARCVSYMLSRTRCFMSESLYFPKAISVKGLFYESQSKLQRFTHLVAPEATNLAQTFAGCKGISANLNLVCPKAWRFDYMFANVSRLILLDSNFWNLGQLNRTCFTSEQPALLPHTAYQPTSELAPSSHAVLVSSTNPGIDFSFASTTPAAVTARDTNNVDAKFDNCNARATDLGAPSPSINPDIGAPDRETNAYATPAPATISTQVSIHNAIANATISITANAPGSHSFSKQVDITLTPEDNFVSPQLEPQAALDCNTKISSNINFSSHASQDSHTSNAYNCARAFNSSNTAYADHNLSARANSNLDPNKHQTAWATQTQTQLFATAKSKDMLGSQLESTSSVMSDVKEGKAGSKLELTSALKLNTKLGVSAKTHAQQAQNSSQLEHAPSSAPQRQEDSARQPISNAALALTAISAISSHAQILNSDSNTVSASNLAADSPADASMNVRENNCSAADLTHASYAAHETYVASTHKTTHAAHIPYTLASAKSRLNSVESLRPTADSWAHPQSMRGMFQGVTLLRAQFSRWNVSGVTNMACMFKNSGICGGLSSWQPVNVTDMHEMFAGSKKFNDQLDAWPVNKVMHFERMFYKAQAFTGKPAAWHINPLAKIKQMFKDSGYDKLQRTPLILSKDKAATCAVATCHLAKSSTAPNSTPSSVSGTTPRSSQSRGQAPWQVPGQTQAHVLNQSKMSDLAENHSSRPKYPFANPGSESSSDSAHGLGLFSDAIDDWETDLAFNAALARTALPTDSTSKPALAAVHASTCTTTPHLTLNTATNAQATSATFEESISNADTTSIREVTPPLTVATVPEPMLSATAPQTASVTLTTVTEPTESTASSFDSESKLEPQSEPTASLTSTFADTSQARPCPPQERGLDASDWLSVMVEMLQQTHRHYLQHFHQSLPEPDLNAPEFNELPKAQKKTPKNQKQDQLSLPKSAAWARRL